MRVGRADNLAKHAALSACVVGGWMVRHGAALITRCRVRPEGRTSLEIIKGRKSNAQITEFGETVLFKIPKTRLNPGKFQDQWDTGIYLGYDKRSMESLIGTSVGVFKVSDIERTG